MSAIATIAGHVANTSDKVVDFMFLELDETGHCVQRALLALDAHRWTAFRLATLVGCS